MTITIKLLVLTFLVSCGNANLFDGDLKSKKPTSQSAQEQEYFEEGLEEEECVDGFQYMDGEKVICDKKEYIKCHEGECVDGVAYINGEIVLCDSDENEFRVIDDVKCVGLKCKEKFDDIDSYETTRIIEERQEKNSDWDFEVDSRTLREQAEVLSNTNTTHDAEGRRVKKVETKRKTRTSSRHDSNGKKVKAPKKAQDPKYTTSSHDSNGRKVKAPKEVKVEEPRYTTSNHDYEGRQQDVKEEEVISTTSSSYDSEGRKQEKKETIIDVKIKKIESSSSWEPCKSDEYRHHGKCLKKNAPIRSIKKAPSRVTKVKSTTPTTRPQAKVVKVPAKKSSWEPCKSDEYRHHGKCLKKKVSIKSKLEKRAQVESAPRVPTKKTPVKSTTPTTRPQAKVVKVPAKKSSWEPCKSDEYRHHGKCLKKKVSVKPAPKKRAQVEPAPRVPTKKTPVKSTTPTTRPQAKVVKVPVKKSSWEPCKSDEYRHHGKCLKKKVASKPAPKKNTKVESVPRVPTKKTPVKSTTPTTRPQAKVVKVPAKKSSWEPCKSDEYRHHGKCLKKKVSTQSTPKERTKVESVEKIPTKQGRVESTTATTKPQAKVVKVPAKKSSWEPCKSDEYRHHGKCLKMDKGSVVVVKEELKKTEKVVCKDNEFLKDGKCVKNKDKKKSSQEVADVFKTKGLTDIGELPNAVKECVNVESVKTKLNFDNPIFEAIVLNLNYKDVQDKKKVEEVRISPLSLKHNNVFTISLKNNKISTLKADRYHSEDFIMEPLAVDYEIDGMGEKELKILKVTSLQGSIKRNSYIVISKDGIHAIVLAEDNKKSLCFN